MVSNNIEEIIVTVSIDTECDHDPLWVRSNPLTFNSIVEGLPNRLQPAFTQSGAIPTYLLTVEVLENTECIDSLKNLPGNFELGTHLHAAFIEPQKKYTDYAGVDCKDFQSSYAPDIEYQKLENITRLFEDKLGYKPTSFRAGRYGASANSVNSLQKLGYKVDSSVTPHLRWEEPNGIVDFRQAPEQPYWPDQNDLAIPAPHSEARILEVPLSIRPGWFRSKPTWFRPWFASVNEMKKVFRYYVNTYADKRILSINMMFHSMEIIEKASPYPQSPMEVQRFLDDMFEVLQWCSTEGVTFKGLSDLQDTYQSVEK